MELGARNFKRVSRTRPHALSKCNEPLKSKVASSLYSSLNNFFFGQLCSSIHRVRSLYNLCSISHMHIHILLDLFKFFVGINTSTAMYAAMHGLSTRRFLYGHVRCNAWALHTTLPLRPCTLQCMGSPHDASSTAMYAAMHGLRLSTWRFLYGHVTSSIEVLKLITCI